MSMMLYILKGKTPICVDQDISKYPDANERIIVRSERGDLLVSTVFLGMDHSWGNGDPILFESMTFKDGSQFEELGCERYTTYDDAIEGHIRMCKLAFGEYTRDDLFVDKL